MSLQLRKVDVEFPCQRSAQRMPAQRGDLHPAVAQDPVDRHATCMEESANRDGEEDAVVRGAIAPLLESEDCNGLDRG